MHEIDVHIVGLQALQRLGELLADDVRVAERGMGTLADQHGLFARAAIFVPLAEQGFRIAGAVDEGGVEDIAALFPEGVEQDGARGEAAEILKAQRHGRGRLAQPGNGALGNDALIGTQRAIGQGMDAVLRLFDGVFDAAILAPGIEHAGIAQAVGPAHAGRGEFLPAGENGLGGGVDLEGIDVPGFVDADGFPVAVLDEVDMAEPLVAVAAGKPEIGHFQPPFRAVDAQHVVEIDHDGAGDLGDDAVLEGEDGGGPIVRAFGIEAGRAAYLDRIGEGAAQRLAGDEAGHRDRIAAHVEYAAARQRRGEEPVLRLEAAHGEAEARLDHPYLADGAGADQFADPGRLRMQAVHEGLAGEGAGLAVGMEYRVDLEGRERQRLFHQHVLAGLGRLDGPFGMAGMGQGDVDGVDLGIGEEGLIAMDDPDAGEVGGEIGPLRVARRYGGEHAMPAAGDTAPERLGDAARPDNAPADFLRHESRPCKK